jgi:hypothetical protein
MFRNCHFILLNVDNVMNYREKKEAPYNHHHLIPSQAMRGWILHEQDIL